MIDLVTVLGHTAAGKTAFAAHLAHEIGGEIISGKTPSARWTGSRRLNSQFLLREEEVIEYPDLFNIQIQLKIKILIDNQQ